MSGKGEDKVALDDASDFICEECGGLDGEHEEDCRTGAKLAAQYEEEEGEDEDDD